LLNTEMIVSASSNEMESDGWMDVKTWCKKMLLSRIEKVVLMY